MHDIDRTQRELEMDHEHEHEAEHEHDGEAFLGALLGEADHEAEHEAEYEAEQEAEHEFHAESPLHEAQEMELASELLEVSNEDELEYFLGRLFKSATRGIGKFARSSIGKMLGGMVKGLAKKALPTAGTALGGRFGGRIGAKIGGGVGNFASGLFEMELEGLSHEDREFEVARQVVRLGAAAANRAARTIRTAPAPVVATRAFKAAARAYAPGLFHGRGAGAAGHVCRTCGLPGRHRHHQGFRARRRHGAPGYAPRGPGVESGGVSGEPVGVNGVSTASPEPAYGEPTSDGHEPMYESNGSTVGSRGGRWFRRGRHIVLTGV